MDALVVAGALAVVLGVVWFAASAVARRYGVSVGRLLLATALLVVASVLLAVAIEGRSSWAWPATAVTTAAGGCLMVGLVRDAQEHWRTHYRR